MTKRNAKNSAALAELKSKRKCLFIFPAVAIYGDQRRVQTWTKQNGNWKIVAYQVTPRKL